MKEIWVIDFAREKGVSRQTIYNAIERGELESVKRFGTTFILDNKKAKEWTPAVTMARPKKEKPKRRPSKK